MKWIILVVCVLMVQFGFSQDFGFFGKKNNISVNGLGNIPLIYTFANNGTTPYKTEGSNIVKGSNLFDYGMNVSYSHAFSGKFALGFEYALNFAKCNGPNLGVINYENNGIYSAAIYLKHEQLSIRTMTYMPKIEFSILGEQLPFGINNQLGIGFSTTAIIEKDYAVSRDDSYFIDPLIASAFDSKKVYNPAISNLKGITVMYGFNIRTPISKNVLINYGIRYTLNTSFNSDKISLDPASTSNYYLTESEIHSIVRTKRITSVLALHIGINYVF